MYDNIIVDSFNYYLTQKDGTYKQTLKRVIDNISNVLLPKLNLNGKLYFLFDPLPSKNTNFSSYKRSSERLLISNFYKKHRGVLKTEDLKGIYLFREYLKSRNPVFVSIYDGVSEADDFVQSLIDNFSGQKIALVSRDSDWSRYISDTCFVTDYNFKKKITPGDYEEVHGYKPTVASVIFDKVLFGDPADSIPRAIGVKQVGFVFEDLRKKYLLVNIYPLAQKFIKEISDSGEKLETIVERIKNYKYDLFIKSNENKSAEFNLFKELITSEKGLENNFIRGILRNVELVKSRFSDNIEKMCHTYTEKDEAFCMLIDAAIGINKFKKSFKDSFGQL